MYKNYLQNITQNILIILFKIKCMNHQGPVQKETLLFFFSMNSGCKKGKRKEYINNN